MLVGLIAGAIAAVVAALVSLPLHSPLDLVFNSLTVTLASLAVGLIAGLLWSGLAANPRRPLFYGGTLAALFIVVVVIAIIGNLWLERFLSFILPLAVIVFILCGVLTPFLQRLQPPSRLAAAVMVIVCLGIGVGLAGQGDTKSGDLSLPERADTSSTPVAQAPTTVPTPVPTQARAATVEPTTVPPTETISATPTPMAAAVSPTTPMTEHPSPTPVPPTTTPAMIAAPSPAADATPASDKRTASAVRYVVGEGSEITFTVGEQLTRLPTPIEAVMRTEDLSGEINIGVEPSSIQVDLYSLASDQQYRDRYVQRRMFPEHPTATFTVSPIAELPLEFENGDTFSYQVDGTLDLNGQDFPISFDLEVRNDGDVLNVLGRTVFTWEQLQIPVPTARSVVWVEDEVDVQVLLVAQRR